MKRGLWKNIGSLDIQKDDLRLPEFKTGNSCDPDIQLGKWYIIKDCEITTAKELSHDVVKYLQPYMAEGTGNIEIRLTMYFLLKENKKIVEYFDLKDIHVKRKYQQVLDAPRLR